MAAGEESKALAWRALWHVAVAFRLLQRLGRRFDPNLTAAPEAKSLTRAVGEPAGLPAQAKKEAGSYPPASLMSLLRQRMIDQVREADFFTNDVIEIRGRLGTEDNRELKINGKPPLKLNLREHAVVLILANFARHVAEASRTAKKSLPAFMPVKSIVAMIDKLTSEGGSLYGRWPYPGDTDVYRCVNNLRSRLYKAGFNPNLIESGQRRSGYRLSTPVDNLVPDTSQEVSGQPGTALFDSVLSPL